MFTGIIEEVGKILSITNNKIVISADAVLCNTNLGESIAVNGVCLTVTGIEGKAFTADISPETYSVTALRNLQSGDFVNLERALPVNGRLGGHIVSGHIDCTGKLKNINRTGAFYEVNIDIPIENAKYIVKKGSISVNGISLTVTDIYSNFVKITVIPHTYENTTLKSLKAGDFVNIETDILAKYVEKFLLTSDNRTGISMEFLKENGF